MLRLFTLIAILVFSLGLGASDLLPINLEIDITKRAEGVEVGLLFTGEQSGESRLKLNPWGGIDELSSHVSNWHVTNMQGIPSGNPIQMSDGVWLIQHGPLEKLRVTYVLKTNARQDASTSEGFYRPIVNEQLFHAVGHNFLALPEHLEGSLNVSIRWHEFDNQSTLTSLGSGQQSFQINTDRDTIYNSLFLAGAVNKRILNLDGNTLIITLQGSDWDFDFEELVSLSQTIVTAEQGFFNDKNFPFYWISAIPVGKPLKQGYQFQGTRLHNNFALYLNPSSQFEYGLATGSPIVNLLAHEMMHTWIGGKLSADEGVKEGTFYWFSEGFTNYFTRKVLLVSGLMTKDQYLNSLNKTLIDYFNNPANQASNDAIAENFWTSRDYQLLPYQRGDLIAFYLDTLLNGKLKSKLVNWLADPEMHQLTTSQFINKFSLQLTKKQRQDLEQFIHSGTHPNWNELSVDCVIVAQQQFPTWDSGFDHHSAFETREIKGVNKASNAYQAGLRDGQTIVSASMQYDDIESPVVLSVKELESEIRYMPHGEIKQIPQVSTVNNRCL